MEKTPKSDPIRAKDVDVTYYAACGVLFLLGLILFLFMLIVCFMAKKSGSTQMLVLLDVLEAVPVLTLLVLWLRTDAICRRKMQYSRAAVERRPDGTARVEYSVGKQRYYLDLSQGEKLGSAGMINIWYDGKEARNLFFGNKPPRKASPYGIANAGVLLTLCIIAVGDHAENIKSEITLYVRGRIDLIIHQVKDKIDRVDQNRRNKSNKNDKDRRDRVGNVLRLLGKIPNGNQRLSLVALFIDAIAEDLGDCIGNVHRLLAVACRHRNVHHASILVIGHLYVAPQCREGHIGIDKVQCLQQDVIGKDQLLVVVDQIRTDGNVGGGGLSAGGRRIASQRPNRRC